MISLRAFKMLFPVAVFYRAMLVRYMLSFCVYLSVCPSHAGIVSKRLNIESCKQCHTISQGRLVLDRVAVIGN